MGRLVAIALVFLISVPTASGLTIEMGGIDLVNPGECCCPETEEPPATPQVEWPCCCELKTPAQAPGENPDALIHGPDNVPAAVMVRLRGDETRGAVERPAMNDASARGPPETLYAQRTSLLL